MRFPPQVVPGPSFYKMFRNYPLLVDNPHLTTDNVGHTKCIVMVPKHYMGVLIGRDGSTIKGLMRQNQVHTQTWQTGHVFVDRTTYNLPVIWTTPMPCFIIFGLQTDVFGILTNFCEIIKSTNHIRYYYSRANLHGPDTMDLYKEQCQKHADYTDKVNLSLTKDMLYKKIYQRISDYQQPIAVTEKIAKFIHTHFTPWEIVPFLRDEDQLVSIIADAKFLQDSGDELTYDNLQLIRDYDIQLETFTNTQKADCSDNIITYDTFQKLVESKGCLAEIIEPGESSKTYELSYDEQYEGEKFIYENQLCYDN